VLVIEAGIDPAQDDGDGADAQASPERSADKLREAYHVPAYHGAATEEPSISWDFSVRHYDNDARQRADPKYNDRRDPSVNGAEGKGGIFYPRASALGGCTSHYAMIIIRPNDSDWDRIAEFTGDESWRSENMQGYFPKLERCLYYVVYKGFLGRVLGGILRWVQYVATLINPRRQLDPGGHGFNGWQPTSFIDPLVVAGIARRDHVFLGLLRDVILSALAERDGRSLLKRALAHLQIIQFLDPNVRSPDITTRKRLSLISIGTDGRYRSGLREWLLAVAKDHPNRLVILTGAHVTRILFERQNNDVVPRAVGVEVSHGLHLYEASPQFKPNGPCKTAQYFACREVIVSGGSFNTPQLLMLSGVGDADNLNGIGIFGLRDRSGAEIAPVVHLPGVGSNLQDRYEVSVTSEMKKEFATLKGASFNPGDVDDPVRAQWLRDGTGLYATNGGALAMMLSSKVNRRTEPDLFVFGAPAAFRGYYWDYSKELLRRTQGASTDQRNLWTWVILKAYTHNNHGTVSLRSADPFRAPEINFHSFCEGPPEYMDDVDALCDAVRKMREINSRIGAMAGEIQPGASVRDDSEALADWVQREAWGHHACGTCRIGADQWQSDVTKLTDKGAVLDSEFRVHGVRNLRVVDASVFPTIPGYFIVTPVFMVSEKAADTILAASKEYPSALEQKEAASIHRRRLIVDGSSVSDRLAPSTLPGDTVGLALSGGGIRSATYCLGLLQALAASGKLRRVDFLSTVSGGGYIGGFLGRLYTRIAEEVADKVERVEAILAENGSSEIWWLRRHADYIGGAGRSDLQTNLAVFARNLAAVHLCIGALLLALLGGLRWVSDIALPAEIASWAIGGITVSPWWRVPAAVLLLAVLPLAAGYWLTPSAKLKRAYPVFAVLLWIVLLGSAVAAVGISNAARWSGIGIGILLLAWVWQEAVRWGIASDNLSFGSGTLVRSRLTRTLGSAILMLAATIAFVIVDSFSRDASTGSVAPVMGGAMLVAAPFLPFLRSLAVSLVPGRFTAAGKQIGDGKRKVIVSVLAFSIAALLFFALDVVAHAAFNTSPKIGVWVVATTLVASAAFGRALIFLNLSSLQQSLAQKLVRTFLGASNDARVHPSGTTAPVAVHIPDEDDDVWFSDYHPERNGGPLHLINVCVNETVDHLSGRQLREDKGMSMCIGPAGVSVARRYHATWEPHPDGRPGNEIDVRALAVAPDPHMFHALARSDRPIATVEQLRLGHWMAISSAALTTGSGRNTSLPMSLLLGLLNVRLGYWWNSGISPGKRPGRYPPGLWRRIKSLPSTIFAVQGMLLNEWRSHFEGPAAKFWYLSDGGHFDNTALYELIRRKLPFMIAVDAAQDHRYELEDVAILTRQVRLDFKADFTWLDPTPARQANNAGWAAFDAAAPMAMPDWIKSFVDPDAIGALEQLKREGPHCAALAHISYADQPKKSSWLLLIKANLAPKIQQDVRNYAVTHPIFPNQPTADQVFNDDQWESYRCLGERAGRTVFGP
jgi:choline dehydrogenase-like flavoprotein